MLVLEQILGKCFSQLSPLEPSSSGKFIGRPGKKSGRRSIWFSSRATAKTRAENSKHIGVKKESVTTVQISLVNSGANPKNNNYLIIYTTLLLLSGCELNKRAKCLNG